MKEALGELRALHRDVQEQARSESYGFFPGGDPRGFSPDPDSCTETELSAHKEACEAWERGERPAAKYSGSYEKFERAGHEITVIACGSSFGIGTFAYEEPFLTDIAERLERVINRLERK